MCKIETLEILPSAQLLHFVRCYRSRTFNTNGQDMIVPWSASAEIILNFNLKDLPKKLVNPATGQILDKPSYGGLLGRGTQYNGEMFLNGDYNAFELIFYPNGFHKIFGMPSREFNNHILHADDIFSSEVRLLYERLSAAETVNEMVAVADLFLLNKVKKIKHIDTRDPITEASIMIVKGKGQFTIDGLAYKANMSIRNFERKFIEQVGVSPKMLSCVTRFNHALDLKLKKPSMSWMSVIHTAGYYDQMHLIKDFKRFAGSTPAIFIDNTPLANESFSSKVNIT